MAGYNEKLAELRYRLSRKQHLEAALDSLYTQRRELSENIRTLESSRDSEQADVDRLEKRGLANLFYSVSGKLEERLEKERAEASAAALRWQSAQRELDGLTYDIEQYEAELRTLEDCQARYDGLLREKMEQVKASGGPEAMELLRLDERIAALCAQIKELKEAVCAGGEARRTTDAILSCLDSAEGWGTWDLIGGGLLSDLAKHSRLDDAQEYVCLLQRQLSRFRAELADVSLDADIQISVDGFLRFADFFFDGLFSSLGVLERIHDAQAQVSRVSSSLAGTISRLGDMLDTAERERAQAEAERKEIVLRAEL